MCHTSHQHAHETLSHTYTYTHTALSLSRASASQPASQQRRAVVAHQQKPPRLTRRKQKKTRVSGRNVAVRGIGRGRGRRRDHARFAPTRKNARSVATKNCQYYLRAYAVLPPRVSPTANFRRRARLTAARRSA